MIYNISGSVNKRSFGHWQIQPYGLCSLFLFRINHFCIHLSCTDISMAKHFADRVNICASGELQGCIRVSKAMVGDVFGYPCFSNPFLYGGG